MHLSRAGELAHAFPFAKKKVHNIFSFTLFRDTKMQLVVAS